MTVPSSLLSQVIECFGVPTHARNIEIAFGSGAPFVDIVGMTNQSITVVLSEACKSDRLRFIFQLAHELVHTLDPVPFGWASVLEEGAATYFQHWYIRTHVRGAPGAWDWPQLTSENAAYAKAHDLVRPIFEADLYTFERLRNSGGRLSPINPDTLVSVVPWLSIPEARILAKRFELWKSP